MRNEKLISYAIDFVSYLIERKKEMNICKIILYGSVARGEETPKSDIDLFVDISEDPKIIEPTINKIKEGFIKSKRYQEYWLLKGVKNEISIVVGELERWRSLKSSIYSNGIQLYGKYVELPKNAMPKTMVYWENVRPESKRVLLSKRIFGYSKDGKHYEGLCERHNLEKLGKGILLIKPENEKEVIGLFRSMGVTYKIRKIIETAK